MQIVINGEQRDFARGTLALSELIDELALAPQRIAVELNKQIVPKEDWNSTSVQDGDRIEIVHFVGGGNSRQQ